MMFAIIPFNRPAQNHTTAGKPCYIVQDDVFELSRDVFDHLKYHYPVVDWQPVLLKSQVEKTNLKRKLQRLTKLPSTKDNWTI